MLDFSIRPCTLKEVSDYIIRFAYSLFDPLKTKRDQPLRVLSAGIEEVQYYSFIHFWYNLLNIFAAKITLFSIIKKSMIMCIWFKVQRTNLILSKITNILV